MLSVEFIKKILANGEDNKEHPIKHGKWLYTFKWYKAQRMEADGKYHWCMVPVVIRHHSEYESLWHQVQRIDNHVSADEWVAHQTGV